MSTNDKSAVPIVPSNGDPDGSRFKEYEAMYKYSITRPEEFWAKEAMVNYKRGFFTAAVVAPHLVYAVPALLF